MKKILKLTVMITLLFIVLPLTGKAAKIQFTDVPKDHWAYESVEWAVDRSLVKGYEDHTYRPNAKLTEAQFATIMSRFFNSGVEQELPKANWLEAHYAFLKTKGVLLPGHANKAMQNKEMTRLGLARALYASRGLAGSDKEVINWIYSENISSGKGVSKDKYEDFGGNDGLKRAHVAAFFKKMDRLGYTTIASSYQDNELRGATFFQAIEPHFHDVGYTFEQLKSTEAQARGDIQEEGMSFYPRIDIVASGDKLFIGNSTPKHDTPVLLTSKTLVAFGIPANPEELAKRLKEFAITIENGETTMQYGDYTLHVRTTSRFVPEIGVQIDGCYIDVVKK